ncbi:DsbA family oxidoreductase, partial [Streptomyces sp. URMC 127]|uniref:DsbA family oxidoreductase n=1 Tax=Streptomyces sp. URMC 127 TaxID=3423402 RepID=UPI003F1D5138
DEVLDEIEEARQRGVTAVPTFVFEGQWAVQGGQEPATFLKVLQQVAEATAPAAEAGDACADGACAV